MEFGGLRSARALVKEDVLIREGVAASVLRRWSVGCLRGDRPLHGDGGRARPSGPGEAPSLV